MSDEVRLAELRQVARHGLEQLVCPRFRSSLVGDAEFESGEYPRPVRPFEPGLLVSVVEAVVPSGESGGGGRGSRLSAPLSVDAVDLLAEVEAVVRVLLSASGVVDPCGCGGAVDLVRMLLRRVCGVELSADLLERVGAWAADVVVRCRELLYPVVRTPLDVACPVCGVREFRLESGVVHAVHAVWAEDEYGQRSVSHAECESCGGLWPRARLWELAPVGEVLGY